MKTNVGANVKKSNCYTAIVAVAKRARQLIDGAPPLIEGTEGKPVSIAIEELKAGKIRWTEKRREAK